MKKVRKTGMKQRKKKEEEETALTEEVFKMAGLSSISSTEAWETLALLKQKQGCLCFKQD